MKKLLCSVIIIWTSLSAVFAAEDLTFYSVYKDYKVHLGYPVQSVLSVSPLVYSILASTNGSPLFSPVPVSSQPVLTYQFLPSTTNNKTVVKISMRPVSVSGQSWNTCFNYAFYPSHAGHLHGGPGQLGGGPPPLDLQSSIPAYDVQGSSCVYELAQNTELSWVMILPEFSAEINFLISAYGDFMDYKRFKIQAKVPALVALPDSDLYSSTGATKAHPFNYYARQDVIDKLKNIAKEYSETFPKALGLVFNDMSLPWGGLFDIGEEVLCPDDKPCKYWVAPHRSHRDGYNVDLKTNGLTAGQLIQIKSIAEKQGASVLDEGNHYHLNFKSKSDKDYDEYNVCY